LLNGRKVKCAKVFQNLVLLPQTFKIRNRAFIIRCMVDDDNFIGNLFDRSLNAFYALAHKCTTVLGRNNDCDVHGISHKAVSDIEVVPTWPIDRMSAFVASFEMLSQNFSNFLLDAGQTGRCSCLARVRAKKRISGICTMH